MLVSFWVVGSAPEERATLTAKIKLNAGFSNDWGNHEEFPLEWYSASQSRSPVDLYNRENFPAPPSAGQGVVDYGG